MIQIIAIVAVLGTPIAAFGYWLIADFIESHRNYKQSLKGLSR